MKTNLPAAALQLVNLIYETTENPNAWNTFLETLSATVQAPAVFSIHDTDDNEGNVVSQVGFDPAQVKAYDAYYHTVNPFINPKLSAMPSGTTIRGEDLCSYEDLVSSEYYQELLRPYEDRLHLVGGVVISEPSLLVLFTMQRSRRLGPYTDKEFALVELLIPHLQRAVRLHQKLGISEGLTKALDSSPSGVILLGHNGKVLFANGKARAIFARKDGLLVDRSGRLCANPVQNHKLQELISLSSRTGEGRGLGVGGAIALCRSSGTAAYSLHIMPIHLPSLSLPKQKPTAVVFVADPSAQVKSGAILYETLFNLTKTEARLAEHLVNGKDLREASEAMAIGRNTARTHLQHLFQKVGVKRQAELVSRLLRNIPF